MDQEITALNRKIDLLASQVQYLTEQAQAAERAREERAELMRDVMPIATDAMQVATRHLQDVEAYVNPDDLVRLLKKLARAAPYIELALDQLDGAKDLLEAAGPIGKEAFNMAETAFDQAERKGYFAFARGGMRIADAVVSSFTEEDVQRLGDNVVLILNTVKDMTQPQIMKLVRNTIQVAEKDLEAPVDTSYRALLGQMRDPNVRRGMALAMRVLRAVGAQSQAVSAQQSAVSK